MTLNDVSAADEMLINEVIDGNTDSYREIVIRYEKKVVGIAYGIVHNEHDAMDIAQEVFLKVYRSLDKFRGQSKFFTWLYRITVNMSIDFKRKKTRKSTVTYDGDIKFMNEIPGRSTSPSKKLFIKEVYNKLNDAIEVLPEDQKATLVLREIENLSYQEIADILKCSTGTVMSRLFYARKKLRDMLKPYLSDGF